MNFCLTSLLAHLVSEPLWIATRANMARMWKATRVRMWIWVWIVRVRIWIAAAVYPGCDVLTSLYP
jgi:hypothetical protein